MTPLVDYTVSGLPPSHMATVLRAVEIILLGVVCSLAIPPTVQQEECHTPDQVTHTEQFDSQSYKIGDRLRYKCQSGFKRKAGTSNLIKCVTIKGHAKWSASNLICIRDPHLEASTFKSPTTDNVHELTSAATTDPILLHTTVNTSESTTVLNFTEEPSTAMTDQNKAETYKATTNSDLSSHTTMRTGDTTPQYVTTWTSTESAKKTTIVPKSEQTEMALSTSAPANKTTPLPNEESSTTANATGIAPYSLPETYKATTNSDLSSHTTMRTGDTTPQYVTTWTSTESAKKTIVPKSEQTEMALSTSAPANKTTPLPNEESSTTANATETSIYLLPGYCAGVFILLVIIPIVLLLCKRVCHCRKYTQCRDRRGRNLDNHEDIQESLALTQLLPQEHVETQQVSTAALPNEEDDERTRL